MPGLLSCRGRLLNRRVHLAQRVGHPLDHFGIKFQTL